MTSSSEHSNYISKAYICMFIYLFFWLNVLCIIAKYFVGGFVFSFFFLVLLGIELRALCFLCSRSAWATSPALFALVIFEIGSCLMRGLTWSVILLFVLPHVAGMTYICYCALPLVEMGVSWTICLDWPWTVILLIPVS
jgi:hypothetical protein